MQASIVRKNTLLTGLAIRHAGYLEDLQECCAAAPLFVAAEEEIAALRTMGSAVPYDYIHEDVAEVLCTRYDMLLDATLTGYICDRLGMAQTS